MNGIRFYLEHDTPSDKRKGNHNGNVFAAFVCNGRTRHGWDGMGAVEYRPNSPVCSCSADADYLRTHCKRIPESRAREVHPRLFVELDRS